METNRMIEPTGQSEKAGDMIGLFEFLKDFQRLRTKIITDVSRHPWSMELVNLPEHPSTRFLPDDQEFILSVTRPNLTASPSPPGLLKTWIAFRFEDPFASPRHFLSQERGSVDEPLSERFEDDPVRTAEWKDWLQAWTDWQAAETPARQALQIYEDLYALRSRMALEDGTSDLYVADGVLNWPEMGINHPILFQRVELQFRSDELRFDLALVDDPPFIPTEIFRDVPDCHPQLAQARKELQTDPTIWPLATTDLNAFLKRFAASIRANGAFTDLRPTPQTDRPVFGRCPLLVLKSKDAGLEMFLDAILDDLKNGAQPPSSLKAIIGEVTAGASDSVTSTGFADEDPSVYFTKPANLEQLSIIHRFRASGHVLVQGPPGTGKTHTIANLIGHLLAEGKSVLVASQTAKALRVLREQVAEPLRPLCVSVLDHDTESKNEIKFGIDALTEELGRTAQANFPAQIEALTQKRHKLIAELRQARRDVRDARASEGIDISLGSEQISPSKAASWLKDNESTHAWIPGPVCPNEAPPFTSEELRDIYDTNAIITRQDELNAPEDLPSPDCFPTHLAYQQLCEEIAELRSRDTSPRSEYLLPLALESTTFEDLTNFDFALSQAVASTESWEPWRRFLCEEAAAGSQVKELFNSLFARHQRVSDLEHSLTELLSVRRPAWAQSITLRDLSTQLDGMIVHLNAGKKLNQVSLLLNKPWRETIEGLTIEGRKPSSIDEFKIIQQAVVLELERDDLRRHWQGIAESRGMPSLDGDLRPEVTLKRFKTLINSAFTWSQDHRDNVLAAAEKAMVSWQAVEALVPSDVRGDIECLVWLDKNVLRQLLARLKDAVRLRDLRLERTKLLNGMTKSKSVTSSPLIYNLVVAAHADDFSGYEVAYAELVRLHGLADILKQRRRLLDKLQPSANAWAEALRTRHGMHGDCRPPGPIGPAWRWKRIECELARIHSLDLDAALAQAHAIGRELNQVTSELAAARAWHMLSERLDDGALQYLNMFKLSLQKLGAGTGKRVVSLLKAARESMVEGRAAVPVWIMTLGRVIQSFTPGSVKFDVLILDEASQLDVVGLAALYLADQVVIVGDNEQTSPESVGVEVNRIKALQETHLPSIKGRENYDDKTSVYDLAKAMFGAPVPLREHFRCVPEIISFSSILSYDMKILPLRDGSSVETRPHVVNIYVPNAVKVGKTNPAEADAIVSLILACSEKPEYQGKTFGVVVMVGNIQDGQRERIEKQVREHLGEEWIERSRFLVGTAPTFQGDERDIVFLSMVDIPLASGPLTFLNEEARESSQKKRFNVAASRARDQLFVVTSLREEDLKRDDLRRKLIDFSLRPGEWLKKTQDFGADSESEFERQVFRDLRSRNFSVEQQYRVGAYRIDMVVTSGTQRVAVECDGERWHGPEKLEQDMARQVTLERLGWRFVRIRGSNYFRDPRTVMESVVAELSRLGVTPAESQDSAGSTNTDTDLLNDLLARAAELRAEWKVNSETKDSSSFPADAPQSILF